MDRINHTAASVSNTGKPQTSGKTKKGQSPAVINTADGFKPAEGVLANASNLKKAADLALSKNLIKRMEYAWEFKTGKGYSIISPPTVYKGALLFNDGKNSYALDPETGKKKWEIHTNSHSSSPPMAGPDNTLLLSTYKTGEGGKVASVDMDTGEKIWEKALGEDPTGMAMAKDGSIFVAQNRKNLLKFDGRTGEKMMEIPNDQYIHVTGVSKKGPVIFNDHKKKTFAVDPDTGKQLWENEDADAEYGVPQSITPRGNVAISTSWGVKILDGKTGKEKWRKETASYPQGAVSFGPDSTVYYRTSDRNAKKYTIHAIDEETGKEKWTAETHAEMKADLTITDDGKLLIGDEKGYVYSFDASNGEKNWESKDNQRRGACTAPTATSEGEIYVGHSFDGGRFHYADRVRVLDSKTGEEIKKMECPSSNYLKQPHVNFNPAKFSLIGSVVIGSDPDNPDLAFFGTGDGKVVAFGNTDRIYNNALQEEEDAPAMEILETDDFVDIGGVRLDVRKFDHLGRF